MIPVHLGWYRPLGDLEIAFDDQEKHPEGMIVASPGDLEEVEYRISTLENPVSLHLANCASDDDLLRFVKRFGMTNQYADHPRLDRMPMAWLRYVHEQISEIFEVLSIADIDQRTDRLDAIELFPWSNLRPGFEKPAGETRSRLVMRPSSLDDLMFMEGAIAIDEGAVAIRCSHCHKRFLIGPLTGRRSHAVYCSDRCRVAAMRARNTKPSNAEETF